MFCFVLFVRSSVFFSFLFFQDSIRSLDFKDKHLANGLPTVLAVSHMINLAIEQLSARAKEADSRGISAGYATAVAHAITTVSCIQNLTSSFTERRLRLIGEQIILDAIEKERTISQGTVIYCCCT